MVRDVAVPPAPGRSSVTLPEPGWLTSRSPCGVHASNRAPGTRAHTFAVHPGGTVSVRGVDSWPPLSPGGTVRLTRTRAVVGAVAEPDVLADPGPAGLAEAALGPPPEADAGPDPDSPPGDPAGAEPLHAVAIRAAATSGRLTCSPRKHRREAIGQSFLARSRRSSI
jgi:hypothetical protein